MKKLILAIFFILMFSSVNAIINNISVDLNNYGTYQREVGITYQVFDTFAGNDANGWGTFTNASVTNNRLEVTLVTNGASGSKNITDFTASDFGFGFNGSIGTGDPNAYIELTLTGGTGSYSLRITNKSPNLNYRLLSGASIILDVNSNSDTNILAIRRDGNFSLYNTSGIIGTVINNDHQNFTTASVLYDETTTTAGTTYWDNIKAFTFIDQNEYYVNRLNYGITYNCTSDANAQIRINDINTTNHQLNCNSSNNAVHSFYTHPSNGFFNIKFFANDANFSSTKISDTNFISDLNVPIADLNHSNITSGFVSGSLFVTMNLSCIDTISPQVDYNIFQDGNIFLNVDRDANSVQSTGVSSSLSGQTIYGRCTDLAGNSATDTNSFTFYSSCYIFLDEELGTPVSTTDINNFFTSLEAKSYLTGTIFSFKNPLANNACFSSTQDDTVRFDLNYSNGLRLYREFNLGLSTQIDSNIGVCLADPQDFFEQAIISARETPVVVQQRISRCYNLIDYTKYSRNDALSLSAFTITAPYDIKTFIDGVLTLLPFINGANENEINLDVLIFRTRETSIPLYPEELSVSIYNTSETNLDSNILKIYYINDANNNVSSRVDVYNDSTIIFTETITSSPNNFTILLDLTDLNFSGTSQKVILTKTLSDGSTSTITRYFSFTGDEAILPPGLIAILAFMFFIFAITLIGWRSAMGLYGLVITILTLGITTLAPGVGWIILIQAGLLITAIFIFIIYKDDTVRSF